MALSSARLRLAAWLFAGSVVSPAGAADFAPLFRPFETDHVTLSPDGRHIAYTQREGEKLFLVLRDLDANSLRRVPLDEDRAKDLSGAREKNPARVNFLGWAEGGRLVFNLNRQNVWSIRADGSDPRRLTDVRDFQPPPRFIGGGGAEPPPPPEPVYRVLNERDQPISVVALPRGDPHVYVEAIAFNQTALNGGDSEPAPRVVRRLHVDTGAVDDWSELERRAEKPIVDQQGHARIATHRFNQRAVAAEFIYARPGSDRWRALDEILAPGLRLGFRESPENFFGERSVPLSFDFNPNLFYFASNFGRDTFGIYALDLKTKQRTDIAIETDAADLANSPGLDASPLVFDGWRKKLVGVRSIGAERTTVWLDPELAEVQRSLRDALPRQTLEIVEWNRDRTRFLLRATGAMQPGTYYLFASGTRRLDEVLETAPWLSAEVLHPATSFGFRSKDGLMLTGYLTLPRHPRLKRPPLVALLHDGPWERDYPGFNPEAQALAAMGFAVVQVNYRGSSGFGRKHLNAITAAPDVGPVGDVLAAIAWVSRSHTFDARFVAVMGRGYGGYLALRALQLHPKIFRCAVTIDALVDLPTWTNPPSAGLSFNGELRRAFLGADRATLRALSPLSAPEKITVPVMLIEREGDTVSRSADLHRALQRLERESVHRVLDAEAASPLPGARAALFAEIEEFLNTYVYNYAVKLGEVVEKDARPAPPVAAPRVERPAVETLPMPELSRPKPKLDESKP